MSHRENAKCKLHEALAAALAHHDVRTLFGVMGDANLFMVDSFVRAHRGRFVGASHEGNAVLMAHGFAQANGAVGVATVTHGPGLGNTVNALAEAARSRTPVVAICGDTPADNPRHTQSIEQRDLVLSTGAGFEQATAAATATDSLATAFFRARVEQRPIVFNVPIEFQWVDVQYRKRVLEAPDTRGFLPSSDDLDNAVGIIAAARRPIVLAGRGAIGAREELLALAKRIEAPVMTTLRAKALFRGESFDLGVCGSLGSPVALEEISRSDCIVAFGASLNAFTRGGSNRRPGALFDGKRVVQIELDPIAVNSNFNATVSVVGDAALTARRICELLDEAEAPGSGYRSAELEEAISACRLDPCVAGDGAPAAEGTIDIRKALLRLDDAVPADRQLVTDVGRFMIEAWRVFSVRDPRNLIHAAGFTSVGNGFGTAIGAAMGKSSPTVLVCGDGGFMMNGLGELNTAVQQNLDLIVIICNDACYGAEYAQFRDRDMDAGMSLLRWPEFSRVSEALGLQSVAVRDETSLEVAVSKIRDRHGPLVIDLKLDPGRIPL